MNDIDQLDVDILDATADDWENLEQIFLSVCFEFNSTTSGTDSHDGFYRRLRPTVLLEELAERIQNLVARGLLYVAKADLPQPTSDSSYVWRGWFSMTVEGRKVWAAAQNTILAEIE